MFGFYLQEQAFCFAPLSVIESFLKDLHKMVFLDSWDTTDHFYKNASFFETRNSLLRKNLVDLLDEDNVDHQFMYTILPGLMRRFNDGYGPYRDIVQFKKAVKHCEYGYLGPKFVDNKPYHITNSSAFIDFKRAYLLDSITGGRFGPYSALLLKRAQLTPDALSQVKGLRVKASKQIIGQLMELDGYLCALNNNNWNLDCHQIEKTTSLTISDESDSVKNDDTLKKQRLFTIPGKGRQYCFIHIKTGDYRIHLFNDSESQIVYVPYIGPHLPTKRSPK